jgi:Polyketide cyclase / dehydrase and lipid transport
MIRFANTIDIAVEPSHVYAYLADLEHNPEWNWAIESTEKVTPGPIGVGTRYRQTRSVPRPGVEMLELTGLDPLRRIEVTGKLGPFDARLTYELAPSGSGTRLTNTADLEPPRPLGFVGGLFGGQIRASVAENLGTLKMVLERGGRER